MTLEAGPEGTKYVRMTIEFWWSDDGHIHIASNFHPKFHTTVNDKEGSKRRHQNLYSKLRDILKEHNRWPNRADE